MHRHLLGQPLRDDAAYRTVKVDDRKKSLNMMCQDAGPLPRGAQVDNEDPLPKACSNERAARLQLYCEFNSWQVCSSCNCIQPRDLTPEAMEKLLPATCTASACIFCRNSKPVASFAPCPDVLRQLPNAILEALKPVEANFGEVQSSKDRFGRGNGYRVHTSMVTFSWRPRTVVQQIAALPAHLQTAANNALEWLLQNLGEASNESAYGDFWEAQLRFLQEHRHPEPR